MAVERRKAFVDYASKGMVKINTPYKSKDFDIDNLTAFNIGVLSSVGDIINLNDLTVKISTASPAPDFFAYITILDPTDLFRGKVVSVAVKTKEGEYTLLKHLSLGQSELFDVKVVV